MTVLPLAPAGWRSIPAWAVCRARNELAVPDLPLLSMSAAFGIRMRDAGEGRAPAEDLTGYRVVRSDDLVVNKLSARDGALAVSAFDGIVSPAYWVFVLDRQLVHPRYVHYLLRSSLYQTEIGRRSKYMPPAQFDLPWEQFRSIPLALPDPDEQRRIAKFLDDQITRLDRAVKLRQQQIKLFAESRAASLAELIFDPALPQTRLAHVA